MPFGGGVLYWNPATVQILHPTSQVTGGDNLLLLKAATKGHCVWFWQSQDGSVAYFRAGKHSSLTSILLTHILVLHLWLISAGLCFSFILPWVKVPLEVMAHTCQAYQNRGWASRGTRCMPGAMRCFWSTPLLGILAEHIGKPNS